MASQPDNLDDNSEFETISGGVEALKGGKSAAKKDLLTLRVEGRGMFPVSRVQKIIKADKELPIVAKEAVFAISIATEEFIKRITVASQKQAEREKRSVVQKKDITAVVKRADEFCFLEDISMWEQEEPVLRPRKKSAGGTSKVEGGLVSLSHFVQPD